MNIVALANAVESADALLEQIGVGWQIEADKVLRKLKVSTFATYF